MNFHGKLEMERMSNLRMDGCEARPELCGEGADVSIRNRSLAVRAAASEVFVVAVEEIWETAPVFISDLGVG